MAITVLAESNFIFEVVFNQEQAYYCEQIISLCEQGLIQLVIPAYCFVEPYEKLTRQEKDRAQLFRQLNIEINQLQRNSRYQSQLHQLETVTQLLANSTTVDQENFDSLCQRLLNTVTIIPLSSHILINIPLYRQNPYELSPQDAVVYCSVLSFLQTDTSSSRYIFLNKNTRDFFIPNIMRELDAHSCKLFSNFEHGYHHITSYLSPFAQED